MSDSNRTRALKRQRLAELQQVFTTTTARYRETVELPLVAAMNLDDEAPVAVTLRPGSLSLDFKCDVERITERALEGEPQLQRVWFDLLSGEQVPTDLANKVVQRCGAAYSKADLPKYFFAPVKGRASEIRRAHD